MKQPYAALPPSSQKDRSRCRFDVTLMTHEEMLGYLRAAGFSDAKVIEREPYEFEYPTRRMYAFAGKPTIR